MSRRPARPASRGSVSAARRWLRVGHSLPDIDVAEQSFWLARLYVEMWRTDGSVLRLECALGYLLEVQQALRVVDGSRSVRRRAARLRRRVRAMCQELLAQGPPGSAPFSAAKRGQVIVPIPGSAEFGPLNSPAPIST